MKKVIQQVSLSLDERKRLLKIVSNGEPKEIFHANILLFLDINNPKGSKTPQQTADLVNKSKQTVNTVKQRYLTYGIDIAVKRKKQVAPSITPKITGDVEAKIITLACGKAPDGNTRWTVRLLANKAVELKIIDSISYVSVSTLLKKRNLSLI